MLTLDVNKEDVNVSVYENNQLNSNNQTINWDSTSRRTVSRQTKTNLMFSAHRKTNSTNALQTIGAVQKR
jgi:hypothetical protein